MTDFLTIFRRDIPDRVGFEWRRLEDLSLIIEPVGRKFEKIGPRGGPHYAVGITEGQARGVLACTLKFTASSKSDSIAWNFHRGRRDAVFGDVSFLRRP